MSLNDSMFEVLADSLMDNVKTYGDTRVKEVLNSLEESLSDTTFHGTSIRVKDNIRDNGYADGVRDFLLAIEAERNKLDKESSR